MKLHLFTPDDVHTIKVPNTYDAHLAHKYVLPLMRNGVSSYISNLSTRLNLLQCGDKLLPVTVNETTWNNAYVCSPFTHYISYAEEELSIVPSAVLRFVLRTVIRLAGIVLKLSDINRVVIVNNWLLSTNLYPSIQEGAFRDITRLLRAQFPSHAIVFRSLNEREHGSYLRSLNECGYWLVGSRQIYLWDTRRPEMLSRSTRKHLTQDQRQLQEDGYSRGPIDMDVEAGRVAKLYSLLYLDKYSYNNPQFTAQFMQHCAAHNILDFSGLYDKNGTLNGAIGIIKLNGVMTTPVLGYDTAKPQRDGLYRRLSTITYLTARESHLNINKSSGAAEFKRLRGCSSAIEYSAVLPASARQKIGWLLIRSIVNGFGIPLMRRYRL